MVSIVNFPYLCSNTPSPPVYGVSISLLIWYARTCSACDQFESKQATKKNQTNKQKKKTKKKKNHKFLLLEDLQFRFKATFRKHYARLNNLLRQYSLPLCQTLSDFYIPITRPFLILILIVNYSVYLI
jgi:hypothetical protein